ncbi:MAG: hypothetical protein NTV60_02635 [Candidatus Kaiserbacteria bacterium]|nr:hypothetical protein [Candidatus Kaiserbacteria bacterium]
MGIEKFKSEFDAWPPGVEAVEKYRPEFIARGGDHLVYRVPDHPDIVVKVSWRKIKDIVHHCHQEGNVMSEDDVRAYAESEYTHDIAQKNAEAKDLRTYFGPEHTLSERRYLMQVPITAEMLHELYKNDYLDRPLPKAAEKVDSVWTHVSVQRYTEEAENKKRLAFCFGNYPEWSHVDHADYEKITTALLDSDSGQISTEQFLQLQDLSKEKYLTSLVTEAETDESLKMALTDFIKHAIHYTSEKGQTLALSGEDNVVFYEKDGKWTYLLVDATPVPAELIYNRAAEIVSGGSQMSESDKSMVVRCLNYVRVINGVAMALGVSDRLPMPHMTHDQLMSVLNK